MKVSKLALFNIVISIIFLFIIIGVNPLIKPFYEFKYEFETDSDLFDFKFSQSEYEIALYESYERLGVYLNQKNILGEFMNYRYYNYDNKFYITYEQLGQNKNKIENIEFIDFYLGILKDIIVYKLTYKNSSALNSKTQLNIRKKYLINLCSKIHSKKIKVYDDETEKLTFSIIVNNYGDSLNFNLKDCKTILEEMKINNLLNEMKELNSLDEFIDLDKLNIEFSFKEIINSKSADLKNILFLYLLALVIINLIILLSVKVSKNKIKNNN